MMSNIARIISFVFHPIFIPLYSILIITYLFDYRYEYVPQKTWNLTITTVMAMTMLMPALVVFIMKKLNLVSDYDISQQKQRIFPYLIFFFFYLMTFMTIKPKLNSSYVFMEDSLLASVLLGATISLAIAFFMNNFYKVSVHTMGVTNLFTLVCLLSRDTQKMTFVLLLITLIAVGLTGSSRIYLRAHTTKEVYFGLICGIVGQVFAYFFYLEAI